jgi:hypothetical protein
VTNVEMEKAAFGEGWPYLGNGIACLTSRANGRVILTSLATKSDLSRLNPVG